MKSERKKKAKLNKQRNSRIRKLLLKVQGKDANIAKYNEKKSKLKVFGLGRNVFNFFLNFIICYLLLEFDNLTIFQG